MIRILIVVVSASSCLAQANLRRTHVVEVFEASRDAIVNVNTTQIVRQRFGFNDPFMEFFGVPGQTRDVKRTSLGSGFVLHERGFIVTNAHVVDRADAVEIILADGRHLPADVVASDTRNDLAILRVQLEAGALLKAVSLGDSEDLMIGEPVVAIGNPLGYEHSVTAGIVSAVKREIAVDDQWSLKGLVQTDASINPGNSGGPLLNAYGQVIGINTVVRGDAENIGFAIPVNYLRELLPELLSPALHRRVDLGGQVRGVVQSKPPATVMSSVWWVPAEGEPAQRLAKINGRKLRGVVDACVALFEVASGQDIVFEDESGAIRRVTAKPAPPSDGERLAAAMLGVDLREPTLSDRRLLGMDNANGLVITAVDPHGPAMRVGLKPGDVIVRLGRYGVGDLEALAVLLSQVQGGEQADLLILRSGRIGRVRMILRKPA